MVRGRKLWGCSTRTFQLTYLISTNHSAAGYTDIQSGIRGRHPVRGQDGTSRDTCGGNRRGPGRRRLRRSAKIPGNGVTCCPGGVRDSGEETRETGMELRVELCFEPRGTPRDREGQQALLFFDPPEATPGRCPF